ncbi:putative bacteriocin export ABC transporter [Enterococcus saccharolyticus]|uniref:ABC transporter domain-containing protein n=1 Tax=Enterococcus saccharolyticus subsp. saccharolyticus ATCC 43076 TaxID=1139996 RepID=S0P2X3_9ENTE|nr:putative bacteriocin export ABC transporter [Enterococcus saccharolyticus]EOT26267.1 hypothetical protein OMQ_02316 [Enterococcus saccharolyticus subsp. saccharolyticus ATCC 43076]EOT82786.1 hypothetical protein I572_00326 [Enterococcus saccharolyticus subsp. saccharolyticus ATCC 43076]
MNAIKITNYSKKFNEKILFSDFNCSIKVGEMIALVGPSGCGKSILLNTIGLIEKLEFGELYIHDKRAPKINSKKANIIIRQEISYLFQNFALIDNFTVEENLIMALKYTNNSKEKKVQIVSNALKEVNLIGYEKMKVYELSGGEQQRVSLARSIIKPSSIILADEPTGSLDSKNRDLVLNILKKINSMGKTILIVTHDEHVANECDRIIEL